MNQKCRTNYFIQHIDTEKLNYLKKIYVGSILVFIIIYTILFQTSKIFRTLYFL